MKKLNDFYRGDTKEVKVTITKADGSPFDLTGATITFTMKKDDTDPDAEAVIQKTAVISTPASGEALLTLTATDTNQDTGEYFYDFQLVDSSGKVTTLLKETISVLQDVTETS